MPATLISKNELHIGDVVIKADLSQSCRDGWISSLQSKIVEHLRKEIRPEFVDYEFSGLSRRAIKSLLLLHPELFTFGKFGVFLKTSREREIDVLESIAEEVLERFCPSGGVTYEVTEVEDPFGGGRQSILTFKGNCWESLVASWWMQLAVRLVYARSGSSPSDMASLITDSDYNDPQSYYSGRKDKTNMLDLWLGNSPCPPSNLWVISGGGPLWTEANRGEISYDHGSSTLYGFVGNYYKQLVDKFEVKEITENA